MGDKVTRIQIANIPITAANTDTPWALPKGCRWFSIQCRTAVDVRVAVQAGKAAGSQPDYFTIKSGTVLKEDNLNIEERLLLWLAAASAVTVEAVLGISEEEA